MYRTESAVHIVVSLGRCRFRAPCMCRPDHGLGAGGDVLVPTCTHAGQDGGTLDAPFRGRQRLDRVAEHVRSDLVPQAARSASSGTSHRSLETVGADALQRPAVFQCYPLEHRPDKMTALVAQGGANERRPRPLGPERPFAEQVREEKQPVRARRRRSQHQNKARAMQILAARLAERAERRNGRAHGHGRPEGPDRLGSQIRSYVLAPFQLVKDLRTDHETGNVVAVLDGDLDLFMESHLRWRRTNSPPDIR